jgi:hypothetical protein
MMYVVVLVEIFLMKGRSLVEEGDIAILPF